MAETKTKQPRLLVTLTAAFAAFCALYLLIGGVWLVAIGGSGTTDCGSGYGWRNRPAFTQKTICSVVVRSVTARNHDLGRLGSRVRLLLTPRSDILVFFGIWLILPFVWRRLIVPSSGAVAGLVVALLISGGILTGPVLTTRRRSMAR